MTEEPGTPEERQPRAGPGQKGAEEPQSAPRASTSPEADVRGEDGLDKTKAGPKKGVRVRPQPEGVAFVFARWEEITGDHPSWWARPHGVGLRLRLEELGDLAHARRTGGIARQAVTKLVREARAVLLHPDGYCARRYGAAVEEVRRSLRDDAVETWVPEAAGPSTLASVLDLIDSDEYLPQLARDLAGDARDADNVDDFRRLESLVELLDAELVYDGHSLAWRRHVLAEVRVRVDGGGELDDAIISSLADNRHARRRAFDILIPVVRFSAPPQGGAGLFPTSPADAITEIIHPWNVDGVEAILASDELASAEAILRYGPDEIEAADLHAAARQASQRFGRDADLWRLRGGTLADALVAYIYDGEAAHAEIVRLPPEPLDLLPRSLGSYDLTDSERGSTIVDNALLQLAQARTAPPATGLVNLWTAAEALFAGAVGDVRGDATAVMAALGELLYLRDLLAWLGSRYVNAEAEGYAEAPSPTTSRWGLERTLVGTTKLLDRLVERNDPLAWYRLKMITRWTRGPSFRAQMTELSDRSDQIGTRAYLLRNFFIHRAEIRARAIDVTLPPFAGLVRECVGYVAANGRPDETLRAAKGAGLRVRHVARRIEEGETTAPEALLPLLPDAGPGAVTSRPERDEATEPAESEVGDPSEVEFTSEVPVEELPEDASSH